MIVRPVLLAALLAVLLAACGGASAPPASPSPSTWSTTPGSTTSPSAAAGTPGTTHVPGTTRSPAAGLPDGFPVFPGATEVDPGDPSRLAAWRIDAAPPDVYDFYLDRLPAAGFTIDLAAPGDTVAIVRFSAPDGTPYQLEFTGVDAVRLALGPPRD